MAVIKIFMAGLAVGRDPDVLETVLGSCVAVMLYDRDRKIGGMVHIMLPDSRGDLSMPGKYADTGIAALRKAMIDQGASPSRLLGAKIAGGSRMFDRLVDVGNNNIARVKEILAAEGIQLLGEHVGGRTSQRVSFCLETGKVTVYLMGQPPVSL